MMRGPILAALLMVAALLPSVTWGWGVAAMTGGAVAASFCAGTELFCEDFEGADTSWDATNGSVDCDGYDADGDYCDDEATVYKNGSEALGIRGSATYYVSENLTSADQGEFYIEGWYRTASTGTAGFDTFGVFTSTGYEVACLYNNWGALYYATKGGSVTVDTTYDLSDNTWIHYGLSFKIETSAVANDGVIRVWVNTDGGTFDAADIKYSSAAVDTGATGDGYAGDRYIFRGPEASVTAYWDDTKVISGACPWAYE